jgi:hypothetical protein
MDKNKTNQKVIVPLFNVLIDEPLQFNIAEDEFIEHLTAHIFPNPILVHPGNKAVKKLPDNEPVAMSVPIPKTIIHLFPWKNHEKESHSTVIPIDHLPVDFDIFDDIGAIAFRSGPSNVLDFQTITQMPTRRQATTLLIIEFEQSYPDVLRNMIHAQNPYEHNLTESLLDAMRLTSANEPHQNKGYHLTNDLLTDIVTKWPLAEMQGSPVKLTASDLQNLKKTLLQIWRIRSDARKSRSCTILTLALGYYYLSSTMTEFRTIFLYLMIAFEALFKKRDENSASRASARMATLLAETKAQYSDLTGFLWGTNKAPGCCKVRNHIVHGESASLPKEMFWQLRALMRSSIQRLCYLILSSQIDRYDYYGSLDKYVNSKFVALPTK